jgi:hypothetical protein
VILSIDQNCHSLWDVLPKLQALASHGHRVRHFVEDVDMAYSAIGAGREDPQVRVAQERYYRGGGADWGAAVFYFEFLGRQPIDVSHWEPFTGLKTAALARKLARSVDDFYDEFSPGDNWQLIGPSYLGDRDHHRLIGDLSVAETAIHLREILDRARADMTHAFPGSDARQRVYDWVTREQGRLEDLLHRFEHASLVDLYRAWLGLYVPRSVRIDVSSSFFACGANPHGTALLETFLQDYDHASGLYNEAIEETSSALRPLRVKDGELPFFAVLRHDGHWARTGAFLGSEGLRIGSRCFPLAPDRRLPMKAMSSGGIRCLAGKAALLVTQVRLGDSGGPLALPYRGSLYMPTAVRLAEKLAAANLVPGRLHPLLRVRFRFLDRLASVDTVIRPPSYLAQALGEEELPARRFGEAWEEIMLQARQRLDSFREETGREAWRQEACADLLEEATQLDGRRRELAGADKPPADEIRPISQRIRKIESEVAERLLRQIANDWQLAELDYWDSRGALLPWCVALGGEDLYNSVVAQAEVYEDHTGND